uniref:uncharacterized protein LOC105353321 n=1 Tax=Fragaria vesca subsp. vesca TaxID=101020 RepID=UPI0005CACE4C|nr:PREDICTED: uncharacterized protein LOC105353321 [Fragaria vesca subsp. vesca]
MTTAENGSEVRVPIFSGENFDFWIIKMETVFISRDLLSYVNEGYVVPAAEGMTNAQRTELRANIKKDAKALGILQTAITDAIFPRIANERTAKGAWDVLKVEFKGSDKVRAVKVQFLRRDFEYTRMNETELLSDYCTRLTDLVNQTKTYAEPIPEKRVVQKILMSLNRKYDAIASIIEEARDIDTLGVQDLMGTLKAFDQRLMSHDEPTEKAFQTLSLNTNSEPSSSNSKKKKNWKGKGKKWEGR